MNSNEIEKELGVMWEKLKTHQSFADESGYGSAWKIMCEEKDEGSIDHVWWQFKHSIDRSDSYLGAEVIEKAKKAIHAATRVVNAELVFKKMNSKLKRASASMEDW